MFMYIFNPCYSGRWSRTKRCTPSYACKRVVLILIVMEDGLVRYRALVTRFCNGSLNPCCGGQWSRTT